ncbi:MAG: Na+/H+ antiporter subunit E [Desulfurococcales archaeon]|nr:Na+/H+ antiporter subunit E [Desulfurococcales archaeon]
MDAKWLGKWAGVSILVFITYIIFSGSISGYDLLTGAIVAVIVGGLVANFVITEPRKLLEVGRLGWLIVYAIYYFFAAEVRAHLDVMKRILHPRMPINPAIVRIPYRVETDYAMTLIANSITNTPGTVVVDLDPEKKIFYVHWIDAKTLEAEKARKHVSESFEYYAKRIFD